MSQGKLKHILNLKGNDGEYSLKEVDCFSITIALQLKTYNDNFYKYFLLLLYNRKLTYFESIDDTIDFNKIMNYIKDLIGIEIYKQTLQSRDNFIKIIKNQLIKNKAIVVPINHFDLFYSPLYKKNEGLHYFVVKGFDADKQLFYLIDNLHLNQGNSPKYCDFSITYDYLYDLFYSSKSRLNEGNIVCTSLTSQIDNQTILETIIGEFRKQILCIDQKYNHILNIVSSITDVSQMQEVLEIINHIAFYEKLLTDIFQVNNQSISERIAEKNRILQNACFKISYSLQKNDDYSKYIAGVTIAKAEEQELYNDLYNFIKKTTGIKMVPI